MEKIKDRVYVETGFLGCNPSFVVTKEGVVMIDTPQQPMEAFRWKKVIQEFGKALYLINTDHHFDHSLGNFYFDAELVKHQGTAKRLLGTEAPISMPKNAKTLAALNTLFNATKS